MATVGGRANLRAVFACNVALPLLIYAIAAKHTSDVNAIALSALPPLLKGLYGVLWHRETDSLSLLQVLSTATCIGLTEALHNPRILLFKDSFFSLAFAASLLLGPCLQDDWNVLWRIYCATAVDTRRLEASWCDPVVRRRFRRLSWLWGTIFLVENMLKIWLILTYPVSTVVYVLPVLGIALVTLVVSLTFAYLQRMQRLDATRPDRVGLL
ncbi:hypothetical protein SPRG_04468 [Saprolegnia parasitica CBS 223.65]|uniref:Uncharacterized protein n=1 Tax=Saprolegnia parasitica (strain CBS 223.65) TaxID=695850 RepID=A0A067CUV5_SAPPC|nr:hypothetical protein SPRG_04468 [Saprolegnia parasitica CBS 223.65]KDO30567.1 hypothetical protein SPRG_04468 [Saprolegnia parasitica CBS 223.65]|eukprot:XP_012198782.1 hypothetical protein SPRG_04468 [Saprolegnia parasitica CBS 223.65]